MWTLSWYAVGFTALFLLLAYALHRWGLVERYQARRAGIKAWIKEKWDWAAAAVITLAPVVWSFGLDAIVFTANFLANIIPALAGVDLSFLMISPEIRMGIQAGGVLLPLIRDAIEKARGK